MVTSAGFSQRSFDEFGLNLNFFKQLKVQFEILLKLSRILMKRVLLEA